VPFIYYGEEIGMRHHEIPLHEGLDPVAARYRYMPQFLVRFLRTRGILLNRDECRLPMQWDDGPNAGFAPAEATPWLPIHRSPSVNVAAQAGDPDSLLSCYRSLLALRRRLPALEAGALELFEARALPKHVVGYRRTLGGEHVDVFLNFGRRVAELTLGDPRGRSLHSNRSGEVTAAPERCSLGAYEGVVVF
jgi:oligo-1,6-glucosidase/alpha-glucosidase